MRLYRYRGFVRVDHEGRSYRLTGVDWNDLITGSELREEVLAAISAGRAVPMSADPPDADLLPPTAGDEVWAAGVTYYRSRDARMQESSESGAASFYDRVYDATRPELFLKATASRVVAHGDEIRIRGDARWSVPEPELALLIDPQGRIVGYTIGNDVSSRDIEGENPLYLPQAKFYDGSCALGPGVLVSDGPLPSETSISLRITRRGEAVFDGATSLGQMKRSPEELVDWLFRETSFPRGCTLLTGTGIVPPDTFTLESGDEVRIEISPIGVLVNRVA